MYLPNLRYLCTQFCFLCWLHLFHWVCWRDLSHAAPSFHVPSRLLPVRLDQLLDIRIFPSRGLLMRRVTPLVLFFRYGRDVQCSLPSAGNFGDCTFSAYPYVWWPCAPAILHLVSELSSIMLIISGEMGNINKGVNCVALSVDDGRAVIEARRLMAISSCQQQLS